MMGVNPFLPAEWSKACLEGARAQGVVVDDKGTWTVEYVPIARQYHLRNTETGARKAIDRDRYLEAAYGTAWEKYQKLRAERRAEAEAYADTWETSRKGLVYRQESRWRTKVDYLKEKALERKMRFLSRVAWRVGLFWGALLLLIATTYLLKWTTYALLS